MSVYRDSPRAQLDTVCDRVRRQGPALRMAPARRAEILHRAIDAVARNESLRPRLAASAGLSEEMVEWALRTTCEPASKAAMTELAEAPTVGGVGDRAVDLALVVLAGNVFTAAVRAVLTPLLFGVPTVVKASSRDDLLVRALAEALEPPFAEALAILSFPRDDQRMGALVGHAAVVHIHGSDETIRTLRAMAPPSSLVLPHGHGLGVALVFADGRTFEQRHTAADRLALDVAAYDGRGCLSPQRIYVLGSPTRAIELGDRLHHALERVEDRLPRGPLSEAVAARQMQWRGVAAATGILFEGRTHAVAIEEDAPLPGPPGYRNVSLHSVPDEAAFLDAVRPLGAHLKVVGVAGEPVEPIAVALDHAPGLVPRVCPVGTMQTPPFDLWPEALPPWHGLFRRVETR